MSQMGGGPYVGNCTPGMNCFNMSQMGGGLNRSNCSYAANWTNGTNGSNGSSCQDLRGPGTGRPALNAPGGRSFGDFVPKGPPP